MSRRRKKIFTVSRKSRGAERDKARPAPARASARAEAPQETEKKGAGFPVVGIGASAGGLEALKQFFSAMSPDSGAAFVLIQHLDPTHESLTAELLSRHTQMSVEQVPRHMPL